MDVKHSDCFNFENFDVVKGFCLINNGLVPYDEAACGSFIAKPKCKNCVNFKEPDDDLIGTCVGLSDSSYWASGDRIAVNCEGYVRVA